MENLTLNTTLIILVIILIYSEINKHLRTKKLDKMIEELTKAITPLIKDLTGPQKTNEIIGHSKNLFSTGHFPNESAFSNYPKRAKINYQQICEIDANMKMNFALVYNGRLIEEWTNRYIETLILFLDNGFGEFEKELIKIYYIPTDLE